jgi:hypothetical protein
MPYMWEGQPRSPPDVRSAAVMETSSPCGKIWKKPSTVYPQEKAIFKPIHILEKF